MQWVGLAGISRHSGGSPGSMSAVSGGGTSGNVVADEAVISMEVRGETTEVNAYMEERAIEIRRAAAMMEGRTCEMELMGHAPSQTSDILFIERIAGMVKEHLPQYTVSGNPNVQNWGSEDIGFMMKRVQEQGGQAVYMRTMTAMASPQHTVHGSMWMKQYSKRRRHFASIIYGICLERAKSNGEKLKWRI